MTRLFIWGLAFVLTISPVKSGAEGEAEKIISAWQEKYRKLSTYTAHYRQSIYQGNELKGETSGKIFFKKPHFFRWDVELPEEEIIIGDGETIWVYLPDSNQAIKKSYSPEESFGPFWFTSTQPIDKIKGHFVIKRPLAVKSSGEALEVLEFHPKRENSDIDRVNIWLEPKNFLPLRVEVFLNDGTLTRFTYNEIKTDALFAEGVFKLNFPEGTEIFEE